ncbi:hypothetical protein DB30_04858 [Enhygromyxa salina]|uniref:Uncharacterized protein n=1 Tax=Enhygromyxa salina TaxID=215803 RepID=A0A0C2D319_9BACT|nr:hypothetical protein DB30_04858 [Enhygromyxa salina]
MTAVHVHRVACPSTPNRTPLNIIILLVGARSRAVIDL